MAQKRAGEQLSRRSLGVLALAPTFFGASASTAEAAGKRRFLGASEAARGFSSGAAFLSGSVLSLARGDAFPMAKTAAAAFPAADAQAKNS